MRHFKQYFILTVLAISCLLVSCKSTQTVTSDYVDISPLPEIKKVDEAVKQVEEDLPESADSIEEAVNNIRAAADSIRSHVPLEVQPIVEPDVTEIKDQSDVIDAQTIQLREMSSKLATARALMLVSVDKVEQMDKQVKRILKERDQLKKERDAAVAAQKDATRKTLRWLIVICVIGGGASVALMIFGSFAVGSTLLAGCAATLTLAIAVDQYLEWIAIGGLVVIAAAIAYAIYQMYSRKKALQEVVQTTEIAKRNLPPEERRRLFGYREEPGLAMAIQSKPTEKMVESIRKELKKSWDHITNDEDSKKMDDYERDRLDRQHRVYKMRKSQVTTDNETNFD